MTTRNIIDLTKPSLCDLQTFVATGDSFVVQVLHDDGHPVNAFTARLEKAKKRHARRWHAYKRFAGILHKHYLGRSNDITFERLHQVTIQMQAIQNKSPS